MLINLTASPRSSKNELTQISENIFKAKITAIPENNKANEAIIKLLSKHFKTAKSNIILVAGKTAKEKIFEIN